MEYDNPNIGERGLMYGKWMTAPDTWTISFGGGVYCYLIAGEERALLFDTAYGMGNLRAFENAKASLCGELPRPLRPYRRQSLVGRGIRRAGSRAGDEEGI